VRVPLVQLDAVPHGHLLRLPTSQHQPEYKTKIKAKLASQCASHERAQTLHRYWRAWPRLCIVRCHRVRKAQHLMTSLTARHINIQSLKHSRLARRTAHDHTAPVEPRCQLTAFITAVPDATRAPALPAARPLHLRLVEVWAAGLRRPRLSEGRAELDDAPPPAPAAAPRGHERLAVAERHAENQWLLRGLGG